MPGSLSPSRGGRCGCCSTRAHRSPRTSQAPSQSPRRRRTSKGWTAREPRLPAVPAAARAAVGLGGQDGWSVARPVRAAWVPGTICVGTCVSHCHTAPPPTGLGAGNLHAARPRCLELRGTDPPSLHVRRARRPLFFQDEPRCPIEPLGPCPQITGYSGLRGGGTVPRNTT